MNDTDLIGLTADIVSAHVSHNNIPTTEVPALIRSVYEALGRAGQPEIKAEPAPEPAVPVRLSIKPDYLVCLEDGKRLKMLKRYLRTNYNMTPDEYRAKWGLPKDYPMVAPSYREARSTLAHQIGLGRKPAKTIAVPAAKAPAKAPKAPVKTAKAPAKSSREDRESAGQGGQGRRAEEAGHPGRQGGGAQAPRLRQNADRLSTPWHRPASSIIPIVGAGSGALASANCQGRRRPTCSTICRQMATASALSPKVA